MAKHGTLGNPKTLHLADMLDIEPWAALGLLEALWDWSAEYAFDGALGRHVDAVIADGIKWRGRPVHLILILVLTGWLDPVSDENVRFVIHDWEQHMQEMVKKRLMRSGKKPYSGVKVERNKWLRASGHCPDGVRTTSRQILDSVSTPSGPNADPVRASAHPIPPRYEDISLSQLRADAVQTPSGQNRNGRENGKASPMPSGPELELMLVHGIRPKPEALPISRILVDEADSQEWVDLRGDHWARGCGTTSTNLSQRRREDAMEAENGR